jgi:glucose/mannose transport system substrate-binding protein
LQIYSTNMLFLSKRAMDKANAEKIPVTWAEFNALAEKMKAAGVTYPIANGGTRPDDGQKFEAALAGISPAAYRTAIMNLDEKALKGPELKAAFAQVRKIADWMDPNTAAQHYSINLQRFVAGDMGMMIQGGWAQGVLLNAGFKLGDFVIAPGPSDNGTPVFLLNADAFIFWQRKEPDLQAGQTLMAQLVMDPAIQTMYSQITGSIPVRTDVDLSAAGWSDGQRRTAAALKEAVAANQAVLSLAHNMAQENGMTAAMIDVITEYVKNKAITPEQAVARLSDAVEGAR